MTPLLAAGVFVAYLALDSLYALYTLAVTRKLAARAAHISAAMYFIIALGVVAWSQSYLYVFPAAAGSWLGTYVTVLRSSKGSGDATSREPGAKP